MTFGNVKAANAIYIGPTQFRSGVQPLLTLRTSQGYTPLFVDVQSIYDVYGDGAVSAPAIRDFLRAETDWQNADRTISVVLVGDGTYDPYNHEGQVVSGRIFAIPPYMADVDPLSTRLPASSASPSQRRRSGHRRRPVGGGPEEQLRRRHLALAVSPCAPKPNSPRW